MFSKVSSTKTKPAEMQMEMLSSALDTYRLDLGRYPEKLADLRTSDNEKWNGPYMPKEIPLDPWDNPYVYERAGDAGTDYILRSYGADGSEGGEGEAADVIYK
jgi:general secretion pathway protein G